MTADGNTIMGFNLPHLFLQPMTGKVGYETDDITVVNVFQLTPHALVVHADSPINTLDEYIAAAKEAPGAMVLCDTVRARSEEHTSELQSLMRISYAVFCLKKKTKTQHTNT